MESMTLALSCHYFGWLLEQLSLPGKSAIPEHMPELATTRWLTDGY
jgi:hypothetical protein